MVHDTIFISRGHNYGLTVNIFNFLGEPFPHTVRFAPEVLPGRHKILKLTRALECSSPKAFVDSEHGRHIMAALHTQMIDSTCDIEQQLYSELRQVLYINSDHDLRSG